MYDLSKYKDDIEDDDDDSNDIWELDPAVFHLVLLCTVTVCVVSLVFLVTWIYLKYKTRYNIIKKKLFTDVQMYNCNPCSDLCIILSIINKWAYFMSSFSVQMEYLYLFYF